MNAADWFSVAPSRAGAPVLVADAVLEAVRAGRLPASQRPKSPDPDPLTPRQREVLTLLLGGHTIPRAARDLGISPSTVQRLTKDAYKRLGVHNRMQAALALGLIGGGP